MAVSDRNLLGQPYPIMLVQSIENAIRTMGKMCLFNDSPVSHQFQCPRHNFQRQLERKLPEIDLC